MRAVSAVLDLLYPRKCILCGALLRREETDLCGDCRRETAEFCRYNRKIPNIADFTAVWYYEDQVRESLIRYKFYNQRSYAPAYGRMMALKVLEHLEMPDVITWVPVSRRRKWERGYDQVELLARAVGRELALPVEKLLDKYRHNAAQSGLDSAAARRANVLGVYRPHQNAQIRGRRILLLDDILTTGATASECARVLRTAGAEEIIFAAAAAGRNHE